MFYYFPALICALIFFGALEAIVFSPRFSLTVALVAIFFSAWQAKKITGRMESLFLFSIFSFFALLLLYFIDSPSQKQFFVFLASALYYLGVIGLHRIKNAPLDQTARGIIAAFIFSGLFFFFCGFYGLYLNFKIPLWTMTLAFLTVTYFFSSRYFLLINNNKKIVHLYSAIISLVMAEIAWMINFWPFGYLTTGIVVLMIYYIFWDLTQNYFLEKLSKKKILILIIVFSFLSSMVLSVSRWLPAV